jgi:DNA adenine methylase
LTTGGLGVTPSRLWPLTGVDTYDLLGQIAIVYPFEPKEAFWDMSSCRRAVAAEPFLRWVGGKRRLICHLLRYLPEDLPKRRYLEPFVGAASLFFAVHPKRAFLSDVNDHLIACYRAIYDNPTLVHAYLSEHSKKSCKKYYYHVRRQYNQFYARKWYSAAQAARFIYLNQTCYNGVFRVNKLSEFNVPYGLKEPPLLPSRDLLRMVSKVLRNADLAVLPFEKALQSASSSDFAYLDPPYPPLNGIANFTHYTTNRFNEYDQRRLADKVTVLDSLGCKFLMTNAAIPLIRQLYRRFNIFELSVTRYVTCRREKHRVSELVITNYDVT